MSWAEAAIIALAAYGLGNKDGSDERAILYEPSRGRSIDTRALSALDNHSCGVVRMKRLILIALASATLAGCNVAEYANPAVAEAHKAIREQQLR